eukprot:1760506-Rhodomonas_salina.2
MVKCGAITGPESALCRRGVSYTFQRPVSAQPFSRSSAGIDHAPLQVETDAHCEKRHRDRGHEGRTLQVRFTSFRVSPSRKTKTQEEDHRRRSEICCLSHWSVHALKRTRHHHMSESVYRPMHTGGLGPTHTIRAVRY